VTNVDEIAIHLRRLRPILAYCKVYSSSWYRDDVRRTGKIGKPAEVNPKGFGTIALTIVDFDTDRQIVHFAHSWGASWGNRGFGEMTLDIAREILVGNQMWAIELLSEAAFGWTNWNSGGDKETD
jgi:hypothetical protein